MTLRVIPALLAVCACALSASDKPTETPKEKNAGPKSKFGPRDVELRVSDGSVIRGEFKSTSSIALKTDYGRLDFPVSEILRITVGSRLTPEQTSEIESAIAKLDSDDFDKRTAAQNKLETLGTEAVAVLQSAAQTSEPEVKTRIDKILKKVLAKTPKAQLEDSVRTRKFEATGTLDLKAFTLSTKLGELTVKLEDVAQVRWLSGGITKNFTIAAAEGLKEWQDTGIDLINGDNFSVQCTGNINLFGSCNSGPAGTTNWGARPFLIGAVIGKFGQSGAPFMIGAGKKMPSNGNERLYIKMFCTDDYLRGDNLNQCSGDFQIKVATGPWADEVQIQPAEVHVDQ